MTISGVMPVHNERPYLPFCLKALEKAPLDELVILLDRCEDGSDRFIFEWTRKKTYPFDLLVTRRSSFKWHSNISEDFNEAFNLASGDIIYSLAGDCIYPNWIFDFRFFKKNDAVCFSFHDYRLGRHFHSSANLVLERLLWRYNVWHGKVLHLPYRTFGVFGIKKEVWKQVGFLDIGEKDYTPQHPPYKYESQFYYDFLRHSFGYKAKMSKVLHLKFQIDTLEKVLGRMRWKG